MHHTYVFAVYIYIYIHVISYMKHQYFMLC